MAHLVLSKICELKFHFNMPIYQKKKMKMTPVPLSYIIGDR